MRAIRVVFGILVAAVLPVLAAAQDKEMAKEKSGEGTSMVMAKPAPEMEKFKWMVGRWSVSETHEPGPSNPGGKGEGTMEITLGPGGFSHVSVYGSSGPMGSYSGRGLTAWDPEAKVYRGVWVDNMTSGIFQSECREGGSDIVCTGEGTMEGKKMSMRTRSISPAPQGWTEVFEISVDGAPYQKIMTLEYKPAS